MNKVTRICSPLSKGYVEEFFTYGNSVMRKSPFILIPHGTAQRRRKMYWINKFQQDLLQEGKMCVSYRLKDWAEDTVQ
ncbi:hypothetical protein TNCV_1526021 [Trichonephila clavipes]|nr:hypothetical protein TNCV_1526021 [Trichonephila clavipes]